MYFYHIFHSLQGNIYISEHMLVIQNSYNLSLESLFLQDIKLIVGNKYEKSLYVNIQVRFRLKILHF